MMEKQKTDKYKIPFFALLSILLILSATFAATTISPIFVHKATTAVDKVQYTITDGAGVIEKEGTVDNIVVDNGSRLIRNLLGFNNVTAANSGGFGSGWYVGCGNTSTIGYSNTTLGTEATTNGFSRSSATVTTASSGTSNPTIYEYVCTCTFTCGGTGTQRFNTVGLFWSPTVGEGLFALASLGQMTWFGAGWQLQITWTIQISH